MFYKAAIHSKVAMAVPGMKESHLKMTKGFECRASWFFVDGERFYTVYSSTCILFIITLSIILFCIFLDI